MLRDHIDFTEEPPIFNVSKTHWAKTWLLHPDAPKVDKPEIIQDLHHKISQKMLSKERENARKISRYSKFRNLIW